MAEFNIELNWKLENNEFDFQNYSKDHEILYSGGIKVNASSSPSYKGNLNYVNPEESLLAALSSCHFLTFISISSMKKLALMSYEDKASAYLDKNEKGKFYVSKIILKPKVKFSTNVSIEDIKSIHQKAHENCFIANSILSKVEVIIE